MQKGVWMRLSALLLVAIAVGIFIYVYNQNKTPKPYELPSNTFIYSREGIVYYGFLDVKFIPSLNWIRSNTPQNETFLSWWEQGHMIRGYAGKEVVAYAPSKSTMWTIGDKDWGEEREGNFTSNEIIYDLAVAYTARDSETTKKIMRRYNAKYIFFAQEYNQKLPHLLTVAGENVRRFLTEDNHFTIIGRETMAYRLSTGQNTGLKLLYEDDHARVYKLGE